MKLIDLGRFDKSVSGEIVWILLAGLMLPALVALLGGATMFQDWHDTEGLEMLVGGAVILAVQIGLLAVGYRRQLAWALGIGWAGFLAIGVLVEFGPSIIHGVLSLIGGIFSWIAVASLIGWELLASITRLEWIVLGGFAVVFLFLRRIAAILSLAVNNQVEQATSIVSELERIRVGLP